jgi:hypothetical protein
VAEGGGDTDALWAAHQLGYATFASGMTHSGRGDLVQRRRDTPAIPVDMRPPKPLFSPDCQREALAWANPPGSKGLSRVRPEMSEK